jgi:hypothetical protein
MNAQRWLALGLVVLLVACIATSNLWLVPLMGGDEAEPTATPTVEVAEDAATTETPEADTSVLEALAEPTLDPDIAAIMNDMEISELGVGLNPHIIRAGDFAVIDPLHQGHGTASIYWFSESQQFLRLDNFEVSNGPDLRVILSQQDTPRTSAETLLPSYVDLGPLKSPSGAQNYEIPATEELAKYKSVVIYSTSLNIVFTSAPLEEVRGQ